jgi:hypothetical protein
MVAMLAIALLSAACDYIVTPADESTPTPATAGVWTAVATAVSQTSGGDLHIDLAIRNETGAWSAMDVAKTGAVDLTTSDGKTTACGTADVGTGGTSLAPGFQVRGFTGGTKAKPDIELLSVECAGASPGAGQKLAIDYSYVTGEFNYYSPSSPRKATLQVDLDSIAADLTYPVAEAKDGVVVNAGDPIEAINKCVLTLASVKRTDDGLELDWHTTNPSKYPTYIHIGTPPVVGSDGIIYGIYESPHLADTPITPAGAAADWTTEVAVPKDVTGLVVLVSVESKQQKNFVSHAIAIADK